MISDSIDDALDNEEAEEETEELTNQAYFREVICICVYVFQNIAAQFGNFNFTGAG